MKTILICSFILIGLNHAQAEPAAICSLINAQKVIQKAEAHSQHDKNRHCSVSCMLTLRCHPDDVMLAGLLKEIKDLFGRGNAEWEDLKADALGIDLAVTKTATTDLQCLKSCDLYYHR
jgi:phosphosulfolactate phosphohydrolase-like enzyme